MGWAWAAWRLRQFSKYPPFPPLPALHHRPQTKERESPKSSNGLGALCVRANGLPPIRCHIHLPPFALSTGLPSTVLGTGRAGRVQDPALEQHSQVGQRAAIGRLRRGGIQTTNFLWRGRGRSTSLADSQTRPVPHNRASRVRSRRNLGNFSYCHRYYFPIDSIPLLCYSY